jgi:hypothetical protein
MLAPEIALDEAGIPRAICDTISEFIDLGETLAREGGALTIPDRTITRGLEGIRRRDAERYDETDTDEHIDRELVRACLTAILGLEASK